jgi:hypothetical protein
MVVGDSVWDLLAARRGGCLGIGLLSGGYGKEELELQANSRRPAYAGDRSHVASATWQLHTLLSMSEAMWSIPLIRKIRKSFRALGKGVRDWGSI